MRDFKAVEEHIGAILKSKLPENLYYHGPHHTYEVLHSAEIIAREEKISDADMLLLKVAVMYHDAGFTRTYKNHEDASCDMAREDLPGFGFTAQEIDKICGMIQATRIPQNPKTQLEKIIADADLEYLGTDNYGPIAQTLYDEIKIYLNVESERQWNIIQMNFLKSHSYHTNFCRLHREAAKQKQLAQVIKTVESYH